MHVGLASLQPTIVPFEIGFVVLLVSFVVLLVRYLVSLDVFLVMPPVQITTHYLNLINENLTKEVLSD